MSNSEKFSGGHESEEDRQAALELAEADPILMRDPRTAEVIKSGGKTPDGEPIPDLGHFLADRKEWLEKNSPILQTGPGPKPKFKDLPPDAKGHN